MCVCVCLFIYLFIYLLAQIEIHKINSNDNNCEIVLNGQKASMNGIYICQCALLWNRHGVRQLTRAQADHNSCYSDSVRSLSRRLSISSERQQQQQQQQDLFSGSEHSFKNTAFTSMGLGATYAKVRQWNNSLKLVQRFDIVRSRTTSRALSCSTYSLRSRLFFTSAALVIQRRRIWIFAYVIKSSVIVAWQPTVVAVSLSSRHWRLLFFVKLPRPITPVTP